ncbi:MAG: CcmD family protein [Actinobacteria bacterium]|nr:MAG: CcmD family protein [Actinomycetota bacterium]
MPESFVYVASAYGAIWLVLLIYMIIIGTRVGKVEKQIELLKGKK